MDKVLFTFRNFEGNIEVESVWATRQGEYYRIDNIPFLAPNISFGDIVSVEEDDGQLYYDNLIQPSGHSTIQLVLLETSCFKYLTESMERMGCSWEGSHLPQLISIDVPKDVNYKSIKFFLDKGEEEHQWTYKESCLAHNY